EPRNLHVTLKFLGETRRADLPRLAEALRELAAHRTSFEAEVGGVGAFPNVRRPDVVWLAVKTGQEALMELAAAVEEACAALGWPREAKPFRAHLTLGRSRTRRPGPRGGGRPDGPAAAERQ